MGAESILLGTAIGSGLSTIAGSLQKKKSYKQQAQQASMEAEANITDRTRALNEAMAMQNAMMGASGRSLSSIASVMQGDKTRLEQESKILRTGAAYQAQQLKQAGRNAVATSAISAVGKIGESIAYGSMLGGEKES